MELLTWTYSHLTELCIFVLVVLIYYKLFKSKWCRNSVCLVGKTVIVTGSNKGLGFESALEFAKRGARVILACRDPKLGNGARNRIIELSQNHNVVVKYVDFASLKTIRNFAADIIENEERLDILVNNIGFATFTNKETEDGFLEMMQINYYGHVLLTILLIELLRKSNHGRIINVSSIMAIFGIIDPNSLNKPLTVFLGSKWKTIREYCDAKLAMIYFTQRLAELMKDHHVSVFSLHPGTVRTDLTHSSWGLPNFLWKMCEILILDSPQKGAQTVVYTATEPGLEKYSGSNFHNCGVFPTYPNARNAVKIMAVFIATVKSLGLESDVRRIITSNPNN